MERMIRSFLISFISKIDEGLDVAVLARPLIYYLRYPTQDLSSSYTQPQIPRIEQNNNLHMLAYIHYIIRG